MTSLDGIAEAMAELVATKLEERIAARIETAVRDALARNPERIVFAPELARAFGKTPAAFAMWLKPGRGGAELAQLAVTKHGRKAWCQADVDAFLARSRPKREPTGTPLRVVEGGR